MLPVAFFFTMSLLALCCCISNQRSDLNALQQQCDRLTDRVRTLEESRATDATRS